MSDESWGRQVALTFGSTELTAGPKKPHELDKATVGRLVYDHLHETLAESAGPSLARAIYDALSLKPGLLGVSLDLKILLEGVFPNLKEHLNDFRFNKADFARLQMLVGTSGVALMVPTTEARRRLGERLFDRLINGGMLAIVDHNAGQNVHVHDLGQRFRGSNHIRRPRQACRTKCG
jgi:hypothetical protein